MAISKDIIGSLKKAFNDDSRFIIESDDKSYFKLKLTKLPDNPNVHFEYSKYSSNDGYVELHLESETGNPREYLCNLRSSVIEELNERAGKPDIEHIPKDKSGSWYGHCYRYKPTSSDHKTVNTIKEHFKKLINIFEPIILRNMKLDTQLKELLKSNHNLILTGAPGTGKTYLAKQIAARMILGKEYDKEVEKDPFFKEHCGFVQFHPSYDYTDFVEGLRPKSDANGNVGFERKDGVFKAFCKEALRSLPKKGENGLKNAYDKLAEDAKNNVVLIKQSKEAKQGNGKLQPIIYDEEKGVIKSVLGTKYPIPFSHIEELSKKYKTIEALDNINNISDAVRDTIRGSQDPTNTWAVLRHLYERYYPENFVFIIDEINRGDISKILGELFFSIDPGYRGEKGRVQTQYQNLIDKGNDIYDEGFYVPENVYIIGTMNDIDRSVESMDFAMRRRFAWKEITAESQMDMLDSLNLSDNDKENAKNRLRNLNNAIKSKEGGIEGLSAAYHIGPAYFMKLEKYKDEGKGAWNSLWKNHIEGVLREYLRGNEDIDKLMADLRNAYDNEKGQKDAPAQGNNEGEESEAVTETGV